MRKFGYNPNLSPDLSSNLLYYNCTINQAIKEVIYEQSQRDRS